ncbi:MAG TPA: hypothetical protein VIA62_19125 [Thermoanaerobaculia bacterium]|jgi:hypothetical protein|nr:hypothetical protein [Thermoanaerobaculia bacterium]
MCEIDVRKRPIIAWWRDGSCETAGHLIVASGIERHTARGDLVLIHDPWPVQTGNPYWLTWRGFACGFKLGGHCVDYFDIQGTGAPPKCYEKQELDDLDCQKTAPAEYEQIHQLSEAEKAITALLEGDFGSSLRRGLKVPDSVRHIICNQRLLIHGARIVFAADGSVALSKIGTTRLLCELQDGTWRAPASIFLIDQQQRGWLLAGFGASQTTEWHRQRSNSLISAFDHKAAANGTPPDERIDLYEVEIPGTGDILLILDDAKDGNLTHHFQAPPGQEPRPLRDVLQDPVGGPGSETLEAWLRGLPPRE